jgi:acetolactate synthase-1/2/3 large subunit
VTILLNNRTYAILNLELARTGASTGGSRASYTGDSTGGSRAKAMLDISRPDLDFTALATGMGLEATRATTSEEFVEQLDHALATRGPRVIEAVIPSLV